MQSTLGCVHSQEFMGRGMDFLDLIQRQHRVDQSCEKFEHERNLKFSTYASGGFVSQYLGQSQTKLALFEFLFT